VTQRFTWALQQVLNGLALDVFLQPRALGLLAALVLAVAAHSDVSAAQRSSPPEKRYPLQINAQALTPALEEFSRQTGLSYGYSPTSASEEATIVGPLSGRYTAEEALDALLPSGFTFEWTSAGTLSIIPPALRVVTAPRTPFGDVLVLGSRIWDSPSLQTPKVTLQRSDIEATGASSLTETLRYLSQQPYARHDFNVNGDQRVELRGLGRDTTLVLINGRRAGGSSAAFDISAFDLNTIPLAAVERIDVYLDSTPISVGTDAIGGMVNIVLKRDPGDPLAQVHYGAAAGGADERRASITAGKASERLRVSTVMDYFERGDLPGAARDRWRDQDYRRYGGLDFRSMSSNPGNVRAVSPVSTLPGLSSSFAAVPPHTAGTLLTPQDFIPTAGLQNRDSLRRFRSIAPERSRISIVASMDGDTTTYSKVFGELFYTEGTTIVHDLPAALANVIVPATNAWNPFGEPVVASFLPISVGPREWTTSASYLRSLAGLQVHWNSWQWEFAALRTEDGTHLTLENDLDPAKVAAALPQSDPGRALNIFDDGPGGSAELLESLVAAPLVTRNSLRTSQLSLQGQGRIAVVPAGALLASVGAEWRKSQIAVEHRLPGSPHRSMSSAFVEFSVPLTSPAMKIPVLRSLSVKAGSRIDAYSDIDTLTDSQFELAWEPVAHVALRGTYGTGYRPPSLFDLKQPVIRVPSTVADLRRDNQISSVTATAGGNPALKSTTAESWSVGLTWTPPNSSDLSLSATWWNAHLHNRLAPVVPQVLLANEELFHGRVTRSVPSESDIAAGRPGALIAIDLTQSNAGSLLASGIDASLSAELQTRIGRLMPKLWVTWMDEFAVTDMPGTPVTERVGLANPSGTILRWRATAAVSWITESLSATAAIRFGSSYDDFNALANRMADRSITASALLDVQLSMRSDRYVKPDSILYGLDLTAGMTNALDDQPPFAEVGVDFGYDITQGDLKGRFTYVRLSKRF
jgi:iron complex outermembrane recepter protein